MKKKITNPQSAFFYLRVSIGLALLLAGIFLALSGFTQFSAQAQPNSTNTPSIDLSLLPPGFDCAQIDSLGIDKQENLGAGLVMIACGRALGGSAADLGETSPFVQELLAPLFGGADVDEVTGTDSGTHITQSETYTLANPDNPNQVVVTYNDSRTAGSCYAGGSFSTDGGATFTRLTPSPFCSGHATNFGDPVTLYNKPTSTFFAIFLATGCGGQGIGAWKSTDGGVTWSVGPCIHNGGSDDRESGWSDNNSASPFFGRMYVSWNDFAVGGNLKIRFSSDNGNTWNERQLAGASPFIRDVQITGDQNGTVYVAGMDEGGGGFPHTNKNHMYRSTDGGNSWTATYTGPGFAGPGVGASGYFACMFNGSPSGVYWRHEGWGQVAALNNVVHLVYAQDGAGADAGDVFYIRSTDSGATFGAPFKLNSDTTTRPNWQPNISVDPNGNLFSMWYDGREFTNCTYGNAAVPCYRTWARKSTDNGLTWAADAAFSDASSPLPSQPDVTVQGVYAGDYDYGSAILGQHVTSWVDGRVSVGGQSQQDAFFDKEVNGGGGGITLTATVLTQGNKHKVKLQWAPADGGQINVIRNDAIIQTTADDGLATDKLGTQTGSFTYQVCETPTGDCSNEVQVQVQ